MNTSAAGIFGYRPLVYYVNGTLTYGFIRSVTYDWEGMRRYYQKSTGTYEKKEKLIVDKIGTVLSATFAAPTLWLWFLGKDLMRLECAVRGKDIADYD